MIAAIHQSLAFLRLFLSAAQQAAPIGSATAAASVLCPLGQQALKGISVVSPWEEYGAGAQGPQGGKGRWG